MCGLTGFWQPDVATERLVPLARAMADAIVHRGPDDHGVWTEPDAGLALAHRRLSILDLSPAGHQPMRSASGRWVIAYNGEVYNHLCLRADLEAQGRAPEWRGHSDTETLLAAVEAWGVDAALRRCVGMFALALWDRAEHALWLARDRLGEKPLYYGWQGQAFLFGSELKALRVHPAFQGGVDRGALALFLRHNHVPTPYSIHVGLHKLPPGTWLRLRAGERGAAPVAYWSLAKVAELGVADPLDVDDTGAVEAVEAALGHAVEVQMLADVPLGALLSGGLDSTAVVALMQARSGQPVRTFTIGFEEQAYDEATHARAVAAHLGTRHTEMRLSSQDALDLIPRLPRIYDEPFADSSQLPTQLVMQLARQHVTVALSGDAGDELFGGYNRYLWAPRVWRRAGCIPTSLRTALFRRAAELADWMPGFAMPQAGDKLRKLAHVYEGSAPADLDSLYVALVSEWPAPAAMVGLGGLLPNRLDDRGAWPRLADPVARMMAMDTLTYLPDDILVKVDRVAMAGSLETRAPFLDHRVVELAWRLPMHMKIRGGKGKWVLRQLLGRRVPRDLLERPKQGFGIPLDRWLRGPLRDWAGDLLAPERLRREGYLDPKPISDTWRRHVRGEGSFGSRLWSVLMFQAWLDEQGRAV